MKKVTVHDKEFEVYLDRDTIWSRVQTIGRQLDIDYKGLNPLFIGVLNGAFIFAADLFRVLNIEAEISFVKLTSYEGTSSTGAVVSAIGLKEDVKDRHVIIVEDIVDTGKTLSEFLPQVLAQSPASLKIASFLTKPEALKHDVKADYVGFEIPNKFVVGYGLDYNGQGRNLTDLYQLVEG